VNLWHLCRLTALKWISSNSQPSSSVTFFQLSVVSFIMYINILFEVLGAGFLTPNP